MKLLFCLCCGDIFNLTMIKKKCVCTGSWGLYEPDGLNAIVSGPCLPLGFANASFREAIRSQPENGLGKEFTAFVIPKHCPTVRGPNE